MPQVNKITVTAQLGSGEVIASRTYDVSVTAAGETELHYLTTPSGLASRYPTEGVADKGPDVFDACAFVDESTGALSFYLAASGGIMKYDPDASVNLDYMEGVDLSYNRGQDANYAFAISGENEAELAALVKEYSNGFYFYVYAAEVHLHR